MRMLMTVEMDTEAANRGIKDGSLPKMMDSALQQMHPEAAYFTTHEGHRTAFIILDINEPAQMVQIAEPFFMGLNAKVDWSPVMNAEDLQKALSQLQERQ
jgi:hypothetical protein